MVERCIGQFLSFNIKYKEYMKANLTSKRLTYFVLFFIVFCMLSCSEKEEQVVSEISLSQPEIEINKLGFGKNGDEAGVEVTSNVYWEITKDENVDWIEVSPMGGTGTTKVVITALKMKENLVLQN